MAEPCSVTNHHHFNLMLANPFLKFVLGFGFAGLGRMGIEGSFLDQVTVFVKDRYLASSTGCGVDCKEP
jgi:hypothetical protein